MNLELDVLLTAIKGGAFLVFFGGFILYVFGNKSFHPQLDAKEFLLPASLFWLFGAFAASLSTNKNPVLLALLYAPMGNFTDDVSLFFFVLAYSFLIIALLRFVRRLFKAAQV